MASAATHVLVFPWPLQGPINCMLPFATGLAGAGVHVTFLHTEHSLRRLARDPSSSTAASPRLRFLSVPDGFPDDHPRSVADFMDFTAGLLTTATGAYRSLLSLLSSASHAAAGGFPPVTCVVADGMIPWGIDIAEELGVPALSFRTLSACSFLAFLSVPELFRRGELPFPAGGGGLDEPVHGVPGMEGFLRRRDLPVECRRHGDTDDDVDPTLHALVDATVHSGKARALILNTAASLEHAALAHIAPHMRDVFAIGPVHAMHPTASGSLWGEDDGCMAWLDGQADRSVVYVSLGSLAVISHEQFTEFLSGLVAAGYPFLWVLRPNMVAVSQDVVLQEVARATTGDGGKQARIVAWAPQRDVLRHRAVGCFLTHAGWNSTLEAVVEGVPMVCWPFFVDQQINSRFVGAVWRNGLDMKDVCERDVVERKVREAMESDQIRQSAQALAQQVKRDVSAGGSSAMEFERLVGFIRRLNTPEPGLPASE